MSIFGGVVLPPMSEVSPDMMQIPRATSARSLFTIYNDPVWPEALHQIFQRICPLESSNQNSKNSEFKELWYTCRSVCKTWRNIIENPLLINPTPEKQRLLHSTFRAGRFATVDDVVYYCNLAANWVQRKINQEVEEQKLTPPSPTRRFGLRCHTEFRLLWRNSSVLQMYASTPVVRDVRIRSFIREVEAVQRKALLANKGFNIPGATVTREWDGWHLNAPGGVMIDMMVGFVALAVEIDVLMQNANNRELLGSPRPRYLDLEFLLIDIQTAKALGVKRFEIPVVEGQNISGRGEMPDLWRDLMNAVNLGGGEGGTRDFEDVFKRLELDRRERDDDDDDEDGDDDEAVDKYRGRKRGQGRM
ncbi:hypothetical protein TWF506_004660 [Arthrobotrys conoides]|uniref:F-box domain-containing protein n=1 Tax=Arthrobotrys conoides TaxID=74498 RepID=A0AAN8NJ96_9PEZI